MRDAMAIVEDGRRLGQPWSRTRAQLHAELPGISPERVDQIRELAHYPECEGDHSRLLAINANCPDVH